MKDTSSAYREVATLDERSIRMFFDDVRCACGKPASSHGLHGDTWRPGECVWTWIGVVKHKLGSLDQGQHTKDVTDG